MTAFLVLLAAGAVTYLFHRLSAESVEGGRFLAASDVAESISLRLAAGLPPQEIVASHWATIRVESAVGKGAMFTIDFPQMPQQAAQECVRSLRERSVRLRAKRFGETAPEPDPPPREALRRGPAEARRAKAEGRRREPGAPIENAPRSPMPRGWGPAASLHSKEAGRGSGSRTPRRNIPGFRR
jgi:hypothetical protein